MKTIRISNTGIVCPYCLFERKAYRKTTEQEQNYIEECNHCGKSYRVSPHLYWNWRTEADCELNDKKHEWQMEHSCKYAGCDKCGKIVKKEELRSKKTKGLKMKKLNECLKMCKCSFCIDVNNHKDDYQTVQEWYEQALENEFIDNKDVDKEMIKEMIKNNTVVKIQFYPDTPIGSYTIHHYNLQEAINIAHNILYEKTIFERL